MNNCTESRLSLLIDLYGITGRELAKAIHVDPSLVSKWLNGKRKLTRRSEHIFKIAKFLLTHGTQTQIRKIIELLKESVPGLDSKNEEILLHSLSEWLTGDHHTLSSSSTDALTFNNGCQIKFKAFRGLAGKRQAVLEFLDMVLSSSKEQELLLMSQEEMSWLTGDRTFLLTWAHKLKTILERKHKITIIHNIDRGINELLSIIAQWLPLHLTGGIDSYYSPKYADSRLKTTLFIIKGKAVIYAMSEDSLPETQYFFFYTDHSILGYYESLYHSFLRDCRPFFKKYFDHNLTDLLAEFSGSESKKGCIYQLGNTPGLNNMPLEVFSTALGESGLPVNWREKYLQEHRKRLNLFDKGLETHRCREILNVDALEALISCSDNVRYNTVLYGLKDVCFNSGHLLEHTTRLIKLLRSNSNYEIALAAYPAEHYIQKVSIRIKENALSTVTTWQEDGKPLVLLSNEITAVSAFYQYCNTIWESIPRINRDREWVINCLEEMVKQ